MNMYWYAKWLIKLLTQFGGSGFPLIGLNYYDKQVGTIINKPRVVINFTKSMVNIYRWKVEYDVQSE